MCYFLLIFRNTQHINSLHPYKDRLNRSLKSKVLYKTSFWGCDDFYIGKTKRRFENGQQTLVGPFIIKS